ncbi:Carbohydrate-binding family 9 [Mucilaginibacter gossypiicola]|uniref:Carbohydrate-binding family 9 n=1 Tax=Mucilaginibacter gossypiicola TaxID=551995 RepID=A0A1H8A3K7_9SPHI|nr:carbohydrate-binding family 9-like protein [Mucilaginibacter gossypiicola]SEM64428.1 Carbohydrate-binding family 9 [Mucilaginibacter gossypiicola]
MISTETIIPFSATGGNTAVLVLRHALWGTAPQQQSLVSIAYDDYGIRLGFDVYDKYLNSKKRNFNDDVHLDNCVEFFLRFPGDNNYYNFEFNCLGSIKAAYGPDRYQREFLQVNVLKQITQNLELSISNQNKTGLINWKINGYIPLQALHFNNITSIKNLVCEANFTKCGDNLTQPNYFSWVYIDTPVPDFHRPELFAQIHFL